MQISHTNHDTPRSRAQRGGARPPPPVLCPRRVSCVALERARINKSLRKRAVFHVCGTVKGADRELRTGGRTEKHPPFVPDSGHGLSGGELGRPPPGPPLARWARVRGSIRDPRLSARWARPTWKSTAHRSVLLAPIARSLCNHNARGRAWRMCRSAATSVD